MTSKYKRIGEELAQPLNGEYDDALYVMRRQLADVVNEHVAQANDEREKRTQWDEYDVEFLGQLLVSASELAGQIDDLDMYCPPGQHGPGSDRDLVEDAKYHARKMAMLVSHLALKARREYDEAKAEAKDGE